MVTKLAVKVFALLPLTVGAVAAPVGMDAVPRGPVDVRQVQAADPTEIAYWNSVKDSRNPAEVQSYIDRFPNGMFVDLARLRLEVLSSAPAAPPPPATAAPPPLAPPPLAPPPVAPLAPPPIVPVSPFPPAQRPAPPPPTAPVVIDVDMNSREIIREIQERLYNLNYDVPVVNGVMGDRTRAAIRRWQSNLSRPETGFMTPEDFAVLRSNVPPKVWGAIAFAGNGDAGTSWNFNNRREAEQRALAACRKVAGRRANCKLLTTFDEACGAVASYRSSRGSEAFAVTRTGGIEVAKQAAMQNCINAPRSNGTCRLRISFCANGAHQS